MILPFIIEHYGQISKEVPPVYQTRYTPHIIINNEFSSSVVKIQLTNQILILIELTWITLPDGRFFIGRGFL